MNVRVMRGAMAVVSYVVLAGVSLVILVPIWWILVSAVSPLHALFSATPVLWPATVQWGNFGRAWHAAPFAIYYLNSLWVNAVIVGLQLTTSSLAAYAFVFTRFAGQRLLFGLVVGAMMIPAQATFIVNFLTLRDVNWVNTYQALIVPFVGSAFGIFLLRQAFLSIPHELIEAMRVDGAGHLRTLWSLVLPNARPALITLAILNYVFHFNSLFWPLVITNSDQFRVLPVGLSMFLQQEGGSGIQWNLMMAADVFSLLPMILLFLVGQRYIVKGVAASGLK